MVACKETEDRNINDTHTTMAVKSRNVSVTLDLTWRQEKEQLLEDVQPPQTLQAQNVRVVVP